MRPFLSITKLPSKPYLRPSINTSNSKSSALDLLLRLPPTCRCFHASPRRRSPLADGLNTAILTTHDAFTALHTITGTSWFLTIPLIALTLRLSLILPITLYTRANLRKQITLAPLIQAWRSPLQKETMKEVGHFGPVKSHATLVKKMRRKRDEIYGSYRCKTWKNFLGFVQIPIFLTAMETLRRMTGSKEGLLGILMSGGTEDGAEDGVLTGDGIVNEALVLVESSMSVEGGLWFPNLLLPDPTLTLPFVLSGTILLNILGGKRQSSGLVQTRFRRSMAVIALLVGPLMLQVPAALVWYWVCSSGGSWVQAMILDKYMPIPQQVKACEPKRPWKPLLGEEDISTADVDDDIGPIRKWFKNRGL